MFHFQERCSWLNKLLTEMGTLLPSPQTLCSIPPFIAVPACAEEAGSEPSGEVELNHAHAAAETYSDADGAAEQKAEDEDAHSDEDEEEDAGDSVGNVDVDEADM